MWRRRSSSWRAWQVAFVREGLVAFGIAVLLPFAEQVFGDAEVGGGLGETASLLGDELDGFEFELGGEIRRSLPIIDLLTMRLHSFRSAHHSWGSPLLGGVRVAL